MAQQITTRLTDDLDPTQEAASTVEFSLDGTSYEIDLSEKNADRLRKAMAPFIAHARRPVRKPKRLTAQRNKEQLNAIREWANSNGYTVSPRGRIPVQVQEAYDTRSTSKPGFAAVEAKVLAAAAKSNGEAK